MAHILFVLDLYSAGGRQAQGDCKEKLFGELLAESLVGEERESH